MNPIARRLLVAAVRKLLPDTLPDNPGAALALRPSDRGIIDRRSADSFLPTARPVQTLYVPPPAPVQPVYAPPPAPPRRRRKKITVTESFSHWRG